MQTTYDRVIHVLALYVLTCHSNCYCVACARNTRQFTQSTLLEICCSGSVDAGAANKEEMPHYKFPSHITEQFTVPVFRSLNLIKPLTSPFQPVKLGAESSPVSF